MQGKKHYIQTKISPLQLNNKENHNCSESKVYLHRIPDGFSSIVEIEPR